MVSCWSLAPAKPVGSTRLRDAERAMSGKKGLITVPFQELRCREEIAGRPPCVCTHVMCARLQAGLLFLVGGVGRCLGVSVEIALASFINCFSNYC